MSLGWSDLKRTVRRRGGGPAQVYPYLLRDERRWPQLALAVDYFESMVGRPRADFDAELLVQFLGDHRLARGIVAALGRHYHYRRRGLADALPPATVARLAAQGIAGPSDLRAALYSHLNSAGHGFATGAARTAALAWLAAQFALPEAAVEALLVLDTDDQAPLVSLGPKPTPATVANTYNHLVASAVLQQAARVELETVCPAEALAAVLRARFEQAGLRPEQVTVGGPRRVVLLNEQDTLGSWVRAGRRLVRALGRTLQHLDAPLRAGRAEVQAPGGPYLCQLDAAIWQAFVAPAVGDTQMAAGSSLLWDPRPEWALRRRKHGTQGWSLRNWPEPLVGARGALFPDFALQRDGRTLAVLVVDTPPLAARVRHLAADFQTGGILLTVPPALQASVAGCSLPSVTLAEEDRLATVLACAESIGGIAASRPPIDPGVDALCEAVRAAGFLPLAHALDALACADADELAARLAAAAPADVQLVPGLGLHTAALLGALQQGRLASAS